MPMLWVYGHHKYVYPFSAGVYFIRQNLTSTDVRFWRIKSVPVLKGLHINTLSSLTQSLSDFLSPGLINGSGALFSASVWSAPSNAAPLVLYSQGMYSINRAISPDFEVFILTGRIRRLLSLALKFLSVVSQRCLLFVFQLNDDTSGTNLSLKISSLHEVMNLCWANVGRPSVTPAQH